MKDTKIKSGRTRPTSKIIELNSRDKKESHTRKEVQSRVKKSLELV